jgi:hypothetical protein
VCCGATENVLALADLKQALALQPADKLLRREYSKLKSDLDQQRVKDTKQFGGLFERGRVVQEGQGGEGKEDRSTGSGMSVEEALSSLKDAESACQVTKEGLYSAYHCFCDYFRDVCRVYTFMLYLSFVPTPHHHSSVIILPACLPPCLSACLLAEVL